MTPPRIEIPHVARRANGQAASGAQVYVYARGTTTQRTVYSGSTGAGTLAQPLTTDANGRIEGWVDPGRHDVVVTVDGATYTQPWDARAGALEDWIIPAFLGTWTNVGGGFGPLRYRKTDDGLVVVQGLVESGTVGTGIFTLPAGYRPTSRLVFPVISNNAIGRIDIETNGNVAAFAGSATWFALNGIIFPAEA